MKRVIVSFLVCFVFIISSVADDKQIRAFWEFVKINEDRILNATNQDVYLWNELNSYLQAMDRSIYALVNKQEDGVFLVITAGGNKNSFQLCDEIVQKAGRLKKLQPVSLIQPSARLEPFIYEMPSGKIYFTIDDVFIHSDNYSGDDIELLILLSPEHQKIVNENNQYDMEGFYYNMCIQMIMQVLGERTIASRISKIDIFYLNLFMPTIPLRKLPAYLK